MNFLRRFIASFLCVLFFALSFNAYACLLPVNGAAPTPMANGCSTATPDKQPVSPYCDTFKTLGLPLNSDDQAFCHAGTVSLAHHGILTSCSNRVPDRPIVGASQDLLFKISVLRI